MKACKLSEFTCKLVKIAKIKDKLQCGANYTNLTYQGYWSVIYLLPLSSHREQLLFTHKVPKENSSEAQSMAARLSSRHQEALSALKKPAPGQSASQ
ncbi:hypothetical protein CEXT_787561 [Caerostris extrusa]|uniref:Uncharacterized protein n=1 Tax=Caerostris extrusa TaxID=172846 RepID=A0AAV4SFS1_CAEEX|nr:hypothetical protein CEXT_787561 [Caerostris extrusa]